MCAPGIKVSVDKHEPNVVKKIHGTSQVGPKQISEKQAIKEISNPLAIPLKVPGIG